MTIEAQLKCEEAYQEVLKRAKELHLPINVNQKLIGFGKEDNFYLFYIYSNKHGKVMFVARKECRKESSTIELELTKNNSNEIIKAINNIHTKYLVSKKTPKEKTETVVEKKEKTRETVRIVDNPSTQINPSDEYRKISVLLGEELNKDRTYFAQLERVPPYYIFDNKTWEALIVNIPTDQKILMRIPGIGKVKASKYGERLIATIKMIVRKYNIDEYQWRRHKRTREPIESNPTPKPVQGQHLNLLMLYL